MPSHAQAGQWLCTLSCQDTKIFTYPTVHVEDRMLEAMIPAVQGLLNKRPGDRLGWPGLLEHPFVRESSQERLKREAALADAAATAQESRAWKGEGGAVAGCHAPDFTICSLPRTFFSCAMPCLFVRKARHRTAFHVHSNLLSILWYSIVSCFD